MEYEVSKTVFSKEAILKVAYLWQDSFVITVSECADNYIISVEAKGSSDFNWEKFNTDLQEQQLRESLNEQFGSLRDSIYKRAFVHFKG